MWFQCWTVGDLIGRCAVSGAHLTWTLPTLAGGNTTAGPFGAVVDVSALSAGRFEVTASVDHPAIPMVTTARRYGWRRSKRAAALLGLGIEPPTVRRGHGPTDPT